MPLFGSIDPHANLKGVFSVLYCLCEYEPEKRKVGMLTLDATTRRHSALL
jgi:hypothetical protein